VYKLNVHENRRFFSSDGWDIVSNFKPLRLPPYLKEVQARRSMRFAYELIKGRSNEEYQDLFEGEIPECVITREDWAEPAIPNTEKVPFQPEA
jgi:hypothetical protein